MKFEGLTALGVATAGALAWNVPTMADDMVEDKLATMEQRIKYLEERVASQDQIGVAITATARQEGRGLVAGRRRSAGAGRRAAEDDQTALPASLKCASGEPKRIDRDVSL